MDAAKCAKITNIFGTTSLTETAGAGLLASSAQAVPSSTQTVGEAHSFNVQQSSKTVEGEVGIEAHSFNVQQSETVEEEVAI